MLVVWSKKKIYNGIEHTKTTRQIIFLFTNFTTYRNLIVNWLVDITNKNNVKLHKKQRKS